MKILLIRNDNIGDLLCTTPSIEALRKKYPNSQIDIVVNNYNFMAIDKNPFVNTIYTYTKPKHKKGIFNKIKALIGKITIMSKIFFTKYDVSIVFRSGYSSSAEQFSNLSGAKTRIGVKDNKGKDNFNEYVLFDEDDHEVEFSYKCVASLGILPSNEKLFFYLPENYKDKYKNLENYILIHISARMKNNKYSKEKFKEIIDSIDENIIISAEPSDIENAKWIERNTKANFIKTSSFLDLCGLISNSKLFITLEGGAMHVAPALGIKTIALFGVSNINRWHPWGYKDLVIQDKTKIAENIAPSLVIQKIKGNL